MDNKAEPGFSPSEIRYLRDIAGTMIPASPEHGVPESQCGVCHPEQT